ncbi:hypothetical protein [Peribacillus sp. SCS-37]|uniref:hypothetical protein n=1 Tax=Paraperibacillus esterisolvens TaxID=3115296 RepID=UPI00390645F8
MDKEWADSLLTQLSNGEISKIEIEKEDFLAFRAVLAAREDFKHFRGIARHHGGVTYEYLTEPRS